MKRAAKRSTVAKTVRGASPGARRTPAVSAREPESQPVQTLQAALGYSFLQPGLLELALTHSSFIYEARLGRAKSNADEPNEPGSDNEQLEFLGDAVLGLAVTELLLREFPGRSEGELTRMRAAVVSRKRMAELGETLRLGDLLRMGKSAEAGEGRRKPAVLANTAEAILGAIYLDVVRGPDARARGGERALRVVREVVGRLLVAPDLPGIRAELEADTGRGALRDAKSRLQERVQAEHAGRLVYADIEETGPAHARQFRVEARLLGPDSQMKRLAAAEGASKKQAQQEAAALALQAWDRDPGAGARPWVESSSEEPATAAARRSRDARA